MLIVVWAVTPLQNGIFSTSVINLDTTVDVQTMNGLMPLADQVVGLSGSFMMAGYGIAWLGQRPPAFTTRSYALAPFQNWYAVDGSLPAAPNQTITAPTTLYQTSLDCAPPANISFTKSFSVASGAFDDGKGCATDSIIPFPNPASRNESTIWAPHYIGYWDDPNLERDLELGGCPRTSNHSFLAVWAKDTNTTATQTFNTASKASALFCTPSYHMQSVNATIALSDFSVLSTVPLGPKTTLSEDLFNVTQFEYILGVGVAPDTFIRADLQKDPARFTDLSNTKIVHQDTQLSDLQIVVPANNMIGYAVGLSDRNLEKLTDPDELHLAFERAHQLLFALAIHELMPNNRNATAGTGVVSSTLQTIRLVPVFALLSQALLMVILLFNCYLLWSSPRRQNHLSTDPNSLSEIMLMGDDTTVQRLFCQSDTATDQALAGVVSVRRFHVEKNLVEGRSKLRLVEEADNISRGNEPPRQGTDHQELVRPVEYSWLYGLPFILSLAAMIAGLCVVRRKGLLERGTALSRDLVNKADFFRSSPPFWKRCCPKFAHKRFARTSGYHTGAMLDLTESNSMHHASHGGASQRTGIGAEISALEVQLDSSSAQHMEGIEGTTFLSCSLKFYRAPREHLDCCFQRPVFAECYLPRSRCIAKVDVAPPGGSRSAVSARTVHRQQHIR